MSAIGVAIVAFFVVAAVLVPVYYLLARRAGRTHRRSGSEVIDLRMNRREDWPFAARAFFALVYFGILAAIAWRAWQFVMAAHGW